MGAQCKKFLLIPYKSFLWKETASPIGIIGNYGISRKKSSACCWKAIINYPVLIPHTFSLHAELFCVIQFQVVVSVWARISPGWNCSSSSHVCCTTSPSTNLRTPPTSHLRESMASPGHQLNSKCAPSHENNGIVRWPWRHIHAIRARVFSFNWYLWTPIVVCSWLY